MDRRWKGKEGREEKKKKGNKNRPTGDPNLEVIRYAL